MLKKWFGKKDQDGEAPGLAAGESDSGAPDTGMATAATTEVEAGEPTKPRSGFLRTGFNKTRERLKGLFGLRGKLDEEALDSIEAALYGADFGPTMVAELLDGEKGLRAAWKAGDIGAQEQVLVHLKSQLKATLHQKQTDLRRASSAPTVYLVAGVNGTGKTTSIAKIARRLLGEGSSVILVAADTFRAAAVEQLTIWSQRLGIDIVTGKAKADPASVVFSGVQRAIDEGIDYVIVDTAGRLHNDKNLMRELKKIRSVIEKKIPDAPHESLLVLDSTNGQNAIQQADSFKQEIDITGIVLTKLDGTARGGVIFVIHEQLDIPVKLVGVGEQIDDLAVFDPDRFVEALFEDDS